MEDYFIHLHFWHKAKIKKTPYIPDCRAVSRPPYTQHNHQCENGEPFLMENTQKCSYPAVDLGLEQMYSKAKMFTVSQCVREAHIRENEEKKKKKL